MSYTSFLRFCHSKLNFIVHASADSSNGKFVFTFIHKANIVKIAVNATVAIPKLLVNRCILQHTAMKFNGE